ncbi:hypothetical protein OSCI_3490039 [Kamptonema sp. PCC 6506]|nr:hypothetical protein OSCI_3490039 [Kamptonema sp. PCC 6506]
MPKGFKACAIAPCSPISQESHFPLAELAAQPEWGESVKSAQK